MEKQSLYWRIFKWSVLLEMLMSLDVFYFWGVNRIVFSALVSFYCLYFYAGHQHYFRTRNNKLITAFFFLLIAFLLCGGTRNLFGWIGALIHFVTPFYVILLKEEKAHDFFDFFKKILSILLLASTAGWLLFLIGEPLPHIPVTFGNIDGDARYYYDNYYLFLVNTQDRLHTIIPRFCSIFTEPGFLGCILSVILFSEDYKFIKKRNYIFLVALILTLSLAGWLISLVGIVFKKIRPSVRNYFNIGLIVLAIFSLSSISRIYNNGNNILYINIFSRLEYDSTIGRFQGYNRSSKDVDHYFYHSFIKSDKLWFGEGNNKANVDLTGAIDWKAYLIRYGLLSGLFVVLYYLWPLLRRGYKRILFGGVAIVFLLIAVQTSYGIFSCMYISLFSLSIKEIEYKNSFYKNIVNR